VKSHRFLDAHHGGDDSDGAWAKVIDPRKNSPASEIAEVTALQTRFILIHNRNIVI
jgi:hypothetical protein